MNNPAHPIYGLLRFTVMMAALCFSLWLFANDFDETEMKSLGTFVALVIGALGVERLGNLKEKLSGRK